MRHPQKPAGLRWLTFRNRPTEFCDVPRHLANLPAHLVECHSSKADCPDTTTKRAFNLGAGDATLAICPTLFRLRKPRWRDSAGLEMGGEFQCQPQWRQWPAIASEGSMCRANASDLAENGPDLGIASNGTRSPSHTQYPLLLLRLWSQWLPASL